MAAEETRIVLVAVDASVHSERAFHWYIDNLHRKKDKLIVFHCHELHPTVFPNAFRSDEWKSLVADQEKQLKALESKYQAKCEAAEASAKIMVHGGHTGPEICRCSVEERVTLIVMATRGHGTIRRTVLGSTSDFVLHHAHVPVIIVPKSK